MQGIISQKLTSGEYIGGLKSQETWGMKTFKAIIAKPQLRTNKDWTRNWGGGKKMEGHRYVGTNHMGRTLQRKEICM